MKVLHLISSAGFYGAENVILSLCRIFNSNGTNASLVCLKNISKADPQIHLQAIKEGFSSAVIPCRQRLDFGTILKIRKLVIEEKIQLIHSHGYKSNLYGLVASRLSKVPIMATLHGWTGETKKLRFYENLDRWIISKIDYLVPVSPMIFEELKTLKLNNNRTTFIPNGIDTEIFNPYKVNTNVRRELGIEDTLVIGSVGRLNYEKGHIYLIKAFEKIQSLIPKARLLIVGDGPLLQNHKSQITNHKLADKVIFTGIRENLLSLYKAMDIFVLASLNEGIPIALLEAMAMELPVIATNVGGIPYIIESDEDGILIAPENSEALAEKISSLLQDRTLRLKMGKNARNNIIERFSIQSLYQRYLKVYQKIIEDGKTN